MTSSAIALGVGLTGCSWVSGIFGGEDDTPEVTSISVMDIQPGQCFNPPADVQAEITEIALIPCDQGHLQEATAIIAYKIPDGAADSFPGQSALATFAEGACAEAFTDYVGVSYLDSALWSTYILPSARGWESEGDRNIVCFVTTTGETLTASVAGSKR